MPAPAPSTTPGDPAAPIVAPVPNLAPAAARARHKSADPLTIRCATVANVLRCS